MELKIYSPTEEGFLKSIEWNHEEIKREVAERVRYYKNLAYTDDQIADAKKDRATLNKFVQELEATRKAVKKQCLAPYEDFEKKIKERKRDWSVIPDTEGDGTDALIYKGSLKAAGEIIKGTATTTDSWQTCTFTAE